MRRAERGEHGEATDVVCCNSRLQTPENESRGKTWIMKGVLRVGDSMRLE